MTDRFLFFAKAVLTILILMALPVQTMADGGFVWRKGADIHEPSQKAIILYDQGREDLILQVRYEGPVRQFGWLVPVPGKPEVAEASMKSFYTLSYQTLSWIREGHLRGHDGPRGRGVRVHEKKIVGDYEIATLSATSAGALDGWLKQNGFNFPEKYRHVLQHYIDKKWYFVAVKVSLEAAYDSTVEEKLRTGELHPLKISFDSVQCVYPLKISSINKGPSKVHIYVISAERRACSDMDFVTPNVNVWSDGFFRGPITFKKYEASPGRPSIYSLKDDLPRLKSSAWYLMKHEASFTSDQMKDLIFIESPCLYGDMQLGELYHEWIEEQGKQLKKEAMEKLPQIVGESLKILVSILGREATEFWWIATQSKEFRRVHIAFASVHAPEVFDKTAPHLELHDLMFVPWEKARINHDKIAKRLVKNLFDPDCTDNKISLIYMIKNLADKGEVALILLREQILDPIKFNRRYMNNPMHWEEFYTYGQILKVFPDEAILDKMLNMLAFPASACTMPDKSYLRRCLIRGLGASGSKKAAPALLPYLAKDCPLWEDALKALEVLDKNISASAIADNRQRRIKRRRGGPNRELMRPFFSNDRDLAWKYAIEGLEMEGAAPAWALELICSMWYKKTQQQKEEVFEIVLNLSKGDQVDYLLSRFAQHLFETAIYETHTDLDDILRKLNAIRVRINKDSNRTKIHEDISSIISLQNRHANLKM